MSTEQINSIVDDATIAPEAKEVPQVTETEPTEKPEPDANEPPQVKDPWPKSAKNKVSRLEGEKRALRAREQQLQSEIAELRAKVAPKEEPPDENDPKFQSYADVIEAKMDWKIKQLQENQNKQQQTQAVSQQEQQWTNQRIQAVDNQQAELLKTNPELQNILQENIEFTQYLPPEIKKVFLEADNAPLAFIALAEEGMLEDLLHMTPIQATRAIAQAEIRGESMLKPKITNAPTPLQPSKGSGNQGKTLDRMSGDELMTWLKA